MLQRLRSDAVHERARDAAVAPDSLWSSGDARGPDTYDLCSLFYLPHPFISFSSFPFSLSFLSLSLSCILSTFFPNISFFVPHFPFLLASFPSISFLFYLIHLPPSFLPFSSFSFLSHFFPFLPFLSLPPLLPSSPPPPPLSSSQDANYEGNNEQLIRGLA